MNRRRGRRVVGALATLLLTPGVTFGQEPERKQNAADTLVAPPPAVDMDTVRLGRDSLVASPGQTYPGGSVHRFFLGELHRDLWTLEFQVPILDLDSVGGGLTLNELSGGKQTLGLRFQGRNGLLYQFRSIVKTPSRAIPSPLRVDPVEDVAQDQMAAQFPLSAMVVAEILQAAGILVAAPRPVIMPDDPRLGEFREVFAGRMGWIEIRPDERETEEGVEYAGFAGSDKITGSEELYEELRDDPESRVDTHKLVRARLIDMLVGDWDRHSDQWRWASYPEGSLTRWEPIPRDRDWAFARIDGLLPRLASVYLPGYVGFGKDVPDAGDLHWNAQRLDRTLLNGLEREDFLEAARELRETLDDRTLEAAVGVLPPSYRDAVGEELLEALRLRRDALEGVAAEFYELLARWVDVYGTEEIDSVAVVPDGDRVRVTLWAPREGDFIRYDRVFHAAETDEVRLYLWEGDDRVVVHGPLPLTVRVVPGEDDDRIVDRGDGTNLLVYGDDGDDELELGPEAFATGSPYLGQDSIRPVGNLSWAPRDWGSAWVPRPEAWYVSDVGPFIGLGVSRYGFGFGHDPYHSRLSLSALNGFDASQWIVDMELDRALGDRGWRGVARAGVRTDEPVWLFGFGNEVPAPTDEDVFRSYRNRVSVELALRYRPREEWVLEVGPALSLAGAVEPGGLVFDTTSAYGAAAFDQVGFGASVRLDTRDSVSYPRSGRRLDIDARVVPSLLDVEDTYGGVGVELGEYFALPVSGEPALHLRLRAEKSWGRTPFFHLPYLGGVDRLPGFVERRFVGDAAASARGLFRVKVLEPRVFTGLQLGLHAVGSVGRVWYGDASGDNTWHAGTGGGAWLRLPGLDRTVSVSFVSGGTGVRTYLDLGFPF